MHPYKVDKNTIQKTKPCFRVFICSRPHDLYTTFMSLALHDSLVPSYVGMIVSLFYCLPNCPTCQQVGDVTRRTVKCINASEHIWIIWQIVVGFTMIFHHKPVIAIPILWMFSMFFGRTDSWAPQMFSVSLSLEAKFVFNIRNKFEVAQKC